jgi:hypothetical protein
MFKIKQMLLFIPPSGSNKVSLFEIRKFWEKTFFKINKTFLVRSVAQTLEFFVQTVIQKILQNCQYTFPCLHELTNYC